MSCGAPEQGSGSRGQEVPGQTVIEGQVLREGSPVAAAYVRLLDSSGEFTAEVLSGPDGDFRFFAAPGDWTLRALAPGGSGTQAVTAGPGLSTVQIAVAAA